MITYEYPFSERIRTLLRLEDVFDKTFHFIRQETSHGHHAALMAIFEIFDITCRADIKTDILKELERQRQVLANSRDNPPLSGKSLADTFCAIQESVDALLATTQKVGQHIRTNEWLMGIKGRTVVPGGVCEFDLPSYHYWHHLPATERREALNEWLQPFLPMSNALAIILCLLRQSASSARQVANQQVFQITPSGHPPQMLRIFLAPDIMYVPVVSANRHLINIRFVHPYSERFANDQIRIEIPFDIALCKL